MKKEEIYNLRNEKCQNILREHTDNTNMADIFSSSVNIDKLT